MALKNIKLEAKLVGDIEGTFLVPSYQRGYRWGKDEVTRLLDDIYSNGVKSYCLQPVVVRKIKDSYELIDGQQRLTTIFILLKYIQKEYKPRIKIKFSITYQTRKDSSNFLNDLDNNKATKNIDFYHMFKAYQSIDAWFKRQSNEDVTADDIYGYLVKYVKIIWYEVDEEEDAISLFTRLNIGKIPLTNAELVKAMFLASESMHREKQEEISLQWDNIEKELHNDSLWCFLTNDVNKWDQTRIDIVLDLIAAENRLFKQDSLKRKDKKTINNVWENFQNKSLFDKYHTFFEFDEMKYNNQSLESIWKKIQHTFLILKDWYEDHELYHKIGYIIASNIATLFEILILSEEETKSVFKSKLDNIIREAINVKDKKGILINYADMSYEKPNEYNKIFNLLLLFNVESVRKIDGQTGRFSFINFKCINKNNTIWSLEHIHAQQSEGLNTQEAWKDWIKLHIPTVKAINSDNTDLIEQMDKAIKKPKLDGDEFNYIQNNVLMLFANYVDTENLHSIANLALLNTSDNAALNNSTFDVKRNEIIEMDKKGQYIPLCTKNVFLKYYTPSEKNQIHFWSRDDRVAYVKEINSVLADYLDEPINIEKEKM